MAETTGRQILGRLLRRTIAIVVLAFVFLFLADYAVLRYRVATNRNAFGTVTVRPIYAVPQKDHKTEFLVDDPTDETCVQSIFPHMGHSPCWYLASHSEKHIDM